MSSKAYIALISLLVLQSCAADYGPEETFGGITINGYKDALMDADTVIVTFDGNRSNSSHTLNSYVLYRAAEITIQNGYDHFIILSMSNSSMNVEVTSRGTTHFATIPPKVYPVVYNSTKIESTRTTQSNTYDPTAVNKNHSITAVIKMFKGNPRNFRNAYDARDVIAHLGPMTS